MHEKNVIYYVHVYSSSPLDLDFEADDHQDQCQSQMAGSQINRVTKKYWFRMIVEGILELSKCPRPSGRGHFDVRSKLLCFAFLLSFAFTRNTRVHV